MKKLLLASASLVFILIVAVVAVWWNLPSVSSYVISRLAGGPVVIGKFDFAYTQGVLSVDIGDLRLDGKVKGNAGSLKLALNLRKGLHFNNLAISDFALTLPTPPKSRKKYDLIPIDLLEARNGVVSYENRAFEVKELVVEHLKNGSPFKFRVDVTKDDWFGNLKVGGDALIKGGSVSARGRASVSRMDMGQWTGDMSGTVVGEGSYVFENMKLAVDGSFVVSGYELRLEELKDDRFHDPLKGTVHLTWEKDIFAIHVKDVVFRDAPFRVDIELKDFDLSLVDVSSGLVDMKEFERYVDLDKMEDGASRVWDYVKGGKVGIKKIRYAAKGRSYADFHVKGVYGAYESREIGDVEGDLYVDDSKFTISGLKGNCGKSSFHGLSSTYTYSDERFKARANYSVDLKDVAPMVNTDDFALHEGITTGTVFVEGKAEGSLDYHGSGHLPEGRVILKTIPLSLKGDYSFTKADITFEPLRVYGDGTDVTVTGTYKPEQAGLRLKGALDAAHVNRVVALPVRTEGVASIDVGIEQKGETLKAQGSVDMKDLFYEVPKVMVKEKGIGNTAHFDLSREHDVFHITRLTYNLGSIDADLKGDIKKDGTMDLDVALKIDGFEKVAGIFAVSETVAKGDAEAVMSLKGVDMKEKKVSFMKGYVNVNNGLLRVPGFTKPFKEINLKADFTGDSFDIRVNGFKCGATVLTQAALQVKGLASPHFNLSLRMENIDAKDFESKSDFKLSSLRPEGALARASGSFTLQAKKVRLATLGAENVEIRGAMADRKINVSEFTADILGGHAGLQGNLDFSGPEPKFYASGKAKEIKSREVLRAFDPKTEILKGTWLAYGSVNSRGEKPEDWLKNMSGNLTLYSQDGVIRKWNLLSKMLGVLNLYDLVRGKVDLNAEGLPYTRMGASFIAKEGLFRTDNFLVDSPAMVITGAGDLDAGKKTIDADITVSPLVAIDSFVDKIPLIGRIFRKKKGGFLFVSYEVKGPMEDPEVRVRYVDTIGGKALNLIKNIFTLPKGVFE